MMATIDADSMVYYQHLTKTMQPRINEQINLSDTYTRSIYSLVIIRTNKDNYHAAI